MIVIIPSAETLDHVMESLQFSLEKSCMHFLHGSKIKPDGLLLTWVNLNLNMDE